MPCLLLLRGGRGYLAAKQIDLAVQLVNVLHILDEVGGRAVGHPHAVEDAYGGRVADIENEHRFADWLLAADGGIAEHLPHRHLRPGHEHGRPRAGEEPHAGATARALRLDGDLAAACAEWRPFIRARTGTTGGC